MVMWRTVAALSLSLLVTGCFPTQRESMPSPSPLTPEQPPEPRTAPTTPVPATPHAVRTTTPDLRDGWEKTGRTDNPELRHRAADQFPHIVFYRGPATVRQAALTFDDGPDVTYTTRILDILRREGIHATFFIVGQRAQAHPEMVRRIVAEGHVVGNHSWDHPNFTKLSIAEIRSELIRTNDLLRSLVGYTPDLFRPPYGELTPALVQTIGSMGFKIIDWSVDTRDWAGTPVPTIMNYVRKEITPGGIILEHCAGGRGERLDNTVEALPRIISYLRNQGYSFVTIPELLHVPATIGTS
ncbi:polysaccharide deacetylase family protein [Kyrpidia spormannii]|uniref:Polysaccharide deacetylase n=1 Tax=Kyrpidia spormannii TaxID=2055160 RepID=A0ACA8Z6M1_9BACL|nr:polysaccharide deacetylase family protein [Kyrpidia spormannii]CAB3389424.1 Polysaccharide deacetylase [Kyrpidia spormannii]